WQLSLPSQTNGQTNQVNLFEKGDESGRTSAGYIAAAMVAPVAESVISGALVSRLGERSLELWPQLLQQLPQNVFYQQSGSLILAHTQDKGDLLSFSQRLKLYDNSTPQVDGAKTKMQWLNGQQIAEIEPELAGRFHQGLYLPTEAQIDNRGLYQALNQALKNNQVQLNWSTQADVAANQVWVNGTAFSFDLVIDCRGMGARADINQLRGVRGEVARVYAPEVQLQRPVRLMHPRYPIYIVPKPQNQYVIGATEIESQSDKPATVRSALELLSAAYSVHPGFAEAEILEIESGLRPTLFDNEPKIFNQAGLMRINGLYRHGFLLAPAMMEQALAVLDANTHTQVNPQVLSTCS
ncbi:thiamine biosynthesis oxidoreductase, partial [Catenovulum agarivorans DS-2]